MEPTLGEQLLLLSLDDESGVRKESAKVVWAISAATLVELALAARIEVTDTAVAVRDPEPVGNPCLDAALAAIAGSAEPANAQTWMRRLKKDAMAGAHQGLLDAGLVREDTTKVLWLFPARRYPESDGSAEASVRARLDAVLFHGEAPDARTASLVALLHGAKLARLVSADTAATMAAMSGIMPGNWASPAVRRAVEAAERALTVTITTSVIGTTVLGD